MRYKPSEPRQPSLEEMLSDPIVWMVMKSDGVDEHELRSLLKRVAADLVVGGASTSGVETMAEPSGGYRRGVGIMLLNNRNEVLVGQRTLPRATLCRCRRAGSTRMRNLAKPLFGN